MDPDEGSYGTIDGIAALVPRHVNVGGTFDATTRPTRDQLVGIVDQVSGVLDAILAQNGFVTPVTGPERALRMLAFFVHEECADIVAGINGSGRFGPNSKQAGGRSRSSIILNDVRQFVESQAVGLEAIGAARERDAVGGVAFRDVDERGNPTFPLFQRAAFGAQFEDWDS